MALKLDNNPGQIYDPEPPKKDGSHDAGAISPGEQAKFDQIEAGERDLASLEKNASNTDGIGSSTTKEEHNLVDKTDDETGGFYTGGKKKQSRFTRKKGIIGGAISATIVSAIIGGFIAFPGYILTQIGDIINGVGDVQISHDLRYKRKNYAKLTDVFSRDGRLGGRMIAEMERVGYKFSYDPASPNKIVGIQRPGARLAATGEGLADELVKFQESRHPFRLASMKTRRMEAFYTRYGVLRKSIVTPDVGPGRVSPDAIAEINKRMYGAIAGEEIDTSTQRIGSTDGLTEEEVAQIDEGVDGVAHNSGTFGDLKKFVADGGDLSLYPDQNLVAAYAESGQGIGPGVISAAENAAKGGSLGGKAFNTIKSFGVSTDIADKLCTVKKRLRTAVTAARSARSANLLRYSLAYATASDGIRKGEAQADLMKELGKRIAGQDHNGNHIGSSQGFAYAIKKRFSKSINDETRSPVAVDGNLTGPLDTIQQKSDIPGCALWQNPYFQIGEAAGEIVLTVITFGGFGAARESAVVAAREATEAGFKASIQRAIKSKLIKSIGLSLAIDISFDGIMALTQLYAERTLTANFLGQEKGALLGDILIGGAGAKVKQKSLDSGQVPATAGAYQVAYEQYFAEKQETIQNESFFARIFNRNNPDSLAFQTASQVALNMNSPSSVAASLSSSIMSSPATVASSLLNLGGGKSYAADEDLIAFDVYKTKGDNSGIELATDPVGNLLTYMPQDILDIDPIANRDELIRLGYVDATTEEPLGDFARHMENCVYATDTITQIEAGDQNNPTEDCLAKLQTTKKFKAHLAYLSMVDSLEAEFYPEEIAGTEAATQTPQTTNTGVSAQFIPDCSVNGGNAAIACTAIDQLAGIPYSRAQRAAPTTLDPVPFLDCSALTGMAVYRTFGVNLGGIASVSYRNNSNFIDISDLRTVQPGDLIGKGTVASGAGGTGHIAIVVSYDAASKKLITFETDRTSLPSRIVTTKGLAVDGTGTYTWAVRYTGPKTRLQ